MNIQRLIWEFILLNGWTRLQIVTCYCGFALDFDAEKAINIGRRTINSQAVFGTHPILVFRSLTSLTFVTEEMSQFDGRNGYHPTYGSTQVKNLCIVLIIH
jgi:hypothetical protein